ncbi:REP-associated tyrosine transposase [Pseudoxanthomonas dokdonensis]|uniref:Transposase IS200-like domain-containing protein n=1 Tax=Pseudoxanthomonas dokdonensis TaxID=344882 RepID=A0A0R0CUX6_9GAMM|nr:transposase [Pseudoxanthomonas dokdonensis]KRG69091.1 hypothetical protein ABB29_11750 [Pseudoxanthomonas dokdonensis]
MSSPRLKIGRVSSPGNIYTVTTITAARRPLFQRAANAQVIIAGMRQCEVEQRLETLAYVVMPEHLHWMFELKADSLCGCVQAFKSRTAIATNAVMKTTGTVWQPGYYDHRLRSDEDLRIQARYLIDNPIRRGLVEAVDQYPFWACKWIANRQDLA